ncbi:hypothetical protein [Mucilaginibacter psychrotolerans]|uniref:Uncharacterized protein n=1 Tax=Mucilaginibacter psychrotolerans TaxID=1524096 RepID=A0A4Y8S869_9SPHI|nr:hypothetical protein [Mucilaginibacter psychrotolerans]TFF35199.1 hypothetical protein E2R66_19740 [Mucilaginibacter psychrotolerans]
MKIITTAFLLITLFTNQCYSQSTPKRLQKVVDAAVKTFTWDIETEEKGSMMFLDVPYDGNGKTEFLTLTVAKDTAADRPAFISVIVPNSLNQKNGIFIAFAQNSAGGGMAIVKASTTRLNFEACNNEDCTARMVKAYAHSDERNQDVDILANMLQYDHVMFLMVYPDGSHKSVAVPLFSFKEQYKKLP